MNLTVLALLFAVAPVVPPVRVTLLGTGNPRPSIERFGPATLVETTGAQPRRLLVDAGRGAATRLFQLGEASLLAGVDCVLLTHLHSDHVVGLPDLWLTGWMFGRARPLPLRGPTGTVALANGLAAAFAFDIHSRRDVDEKLPAAGVELDAVEVQPDAPFECGGFRVTAFTVDHGPVVPAYGYRVEVDGRVIVFSGDTRATDAVTRRARGADLLVHEVVSPDVERRRAKVDPALIERIIARHTLPEEAGRLFTAAAPRLAVYSHVVPSVTRAEDLLGPTRRTYKGPLEVGEDLMAIEVGERVRVLRPSR